MLGRACVVAAVLVVTAQPAHAYEFWLRTRAIGQAYQLRDYRLVGPDLFHGRRRVTQFIALRLFDIGDLGAARRLARLPDRGPRISWQSHLRIDHDFGDYTMGRMTLRGPIRRDALDVIPELGESVAGLDLMYGFLQVDGLADDRLSLRLGRILIDDGWGGSGLDGATARYELPAPVAVSAAAGWRVRASSPLGVANYELDGTSGAGCREYVEGATPGTGSWQLVDRNRTVTNRRLSSDYEFCPQREVAQPTIGATIATARTRRFGAELGYRRTWSPTVGLIGTVDRLTYPDRGLYPNEFGQAPATGVNEERVHARAHADVQIGRTVLSAHTNVRFSLLHGLFDRGDAGVRIQRGAHSVEPAVEYFFPTFDGDSIFNAFSIAPTTDLRAGYQYDPGGRWRAHAHGWLRRYAREAELATFAGGADMGVQRKLGAKGRARVDVMWDDGWGGRRIGGAGDAGWRHRMVWLRGRVVVLGVREDETWRGRRYVTSSTVLSTTIQVSDFAAVHAIGEVDYDAIHAVQTRALVVIDLAFIPEP
jgi:hypothetical protein